MGCGDKKLSKYLTQTFTAHCNAMICQQVTLSGDAEWPKVADAVIEAENFSLTRQGGHRTIGSWELASRSTAEGWGNALSGARPVDTAPTQLGKTSRTKYLITEW
jgi:hypothetical protein